MRGVEGAEQSAFFCFPLNHINNLVLLVILSTNV